MYSIPALQWVFRRSNHQKMIWESMAVLSSSDRFLSLCTRSQSSSWGQSWLMHRVGRKRKQVRWTLYTQTGDAKRVTKQSRQSRTSRRGTTLYIMFSCTGFSISVAGTVLSLYIDSLQSNAGRIPHTAWIPFLPCLLSYIFQMTFCWTFLGFPFTINDCFSCWNAVLGIEGYTFRIGTLDVNIGTKLRMLSDKINVHLGRPYTKLRWVAAVYMGIFALVFLVNFMGLYYMMNAGSAGCWDLNPKLFYFTLFQVRLN